MKIVSWNMQNKRDSWRFLVDQHQHYDFAFVQEACTPTPYVRRQAAEWDIPYERWQARPNRYKQEVLRISDAWTFFRLDRDTIGSFRPDGSEILVPRFRAAAVVRRAGQPDVCLVCVVSGPKRSVRLADTVRAVRRTLAAASLDSQMPMIAAGDLTTNPKRTPQTFTHMAEIGMHHLGPDCPNFISKPQGETPGTAHRRLNHVFVTEDLVERVSVTALNHPDETHPDYWGPSDHCRILIEVGE